MHSRQILAILNSIVIIAVIVWNYLANSAAIAGNTISSLSDQYHNLFTPADYAFAIWGLIFLSLIALGCYMINCAFDSKQDDAFISQIGPWLIIANLLNAAWLWFWLSEQTAISVVVMLGILFSLMVAIVRLNMERWDAPLSIIIWVWWPLCLYSGWIAVATIANASAYLAKINWTGGLNELTWAVLLIAVATLLNLLMIWTRNMREFALVGTWALVAIAVRHWDTQPVLKYEALICAAILFIVVSIHGYQNRKTGPFTKF